MKGKVIALAVVVVLVAAGAFAATRGKTKKSSPSTGTSIRVTTSGRSGSSALSSSLKSLLSDRTAQTCTLALNTSGQNKNAKIYSDGNGKLHYSLGITGSSGNVISAVNVLINGQSAYEWTTTNGQTSGVKTSLASLEAAAEANVPLDAVQNLSCSSGVDSSQFALPANVTFTTEPGFDAPAPTK